MDYQDVSPLRVQRDVTLAMVLEPLAEKEGCTTRQIDLSSETSLANFQTAAVNAGVYFYELATRIRDAKGQPSVYEDLFFQALSTSLEGTGSRKYITYGLLELFFHFVVARLTVRGDGVAVCRAIPEILKKSSREDVVWLDKTRALAWTTSRKDYKKSFTDSIGGRNLFDHYQLNLKLAEDINFTTGEIWTRQLLAGLPLVQKMYQGARAAIKRKEPKLEYLAKVYDLVEPDFPSQGGRADYTGIVLYLLIAENPDQQLYF